MKKLLLFLTVALVAFSSCDKENRGSSNETGDVQFNLSGDFEKSSEKDGTIDCQDEVSYVFAIIDGEEYTLPVYYVGDMLTTSSLKMPVGEHTVSEFLGYNNNGTPEDMTDDVAIFATPHEGSEYASLVSETLSLTFSVEAFVKIERHIELVCFTPSEYDNFGFEFFTLWLTEIHSRYWFADWCIQCVEDLEGSIYEEAGIQADMAAILKVDVYRNGEMTGSYDNVANLGMGEPLCTYFADRDGILDEFEFMVYAWLPVGDAFDWVYLFSEYSVDGENYEGTDGIFDFVIGDCTIGESDLVLPVYVNLPSEVTFSLGNQVAPSTLGGYFDISYSGIVGTYAIENADYPAFCAQSDVFISLGVEYTGNVYHSLDPVTAAANTDLDVTTIKKLHYFVNQLATLDLYDLTVNDWNNIQTVIWHYTNGGTYGSGIQSTAVADIDANYASYVPTGQDEYFFVIIYHDDNTQLQVQSLTLCD